MTDPIEPHPFDPPGALLALGRCLERSLRPLRVFGKELTDSLHRERQAGSIFVDVAMVAGILGLVDLPDPDEKKPRKSETRREMAAERLGNQVGHPIQPERWNAERAQFTEALRNLSDSVDQEFTLRKLTLGAIFASISEALGDWTPGEIRDDPKGALAEIRKRVRRSVEEDLRGPGYRSKKEQAWSSFGTERVSGSSGLAGFEAIETALTLDSLLLIAEQHGCPLTKSEADVFQLQRQALGRDEIAKRLGSTPGSVRALHTKGIKKLRRAWAETDPEKSLATSLSLTQKAPTTTPRFLSR